MDPKDEVVGGFHVLHTFVGCRKLVSSGFPKGSHKQLIVISWKKGSFLKDWVKQSETSFFVMVLLEPTIW